MIALIFDTETTGIDDPVLVEAAYMQAINASSPRQAGGELFCQRYNPGKPISLGAMATHHIMDGDLTGCPPASEFSLPANVDYLIGHNVDFDWRVIGEPDIKRICTLALCRKLWPEADSHSQSAMLYLLERNTARARLGSAHSADADIRVCLVLLQHIVRHLSDISTWEDLWAASELARVPDVMPFGKHKGMPIADVPADYKRWLLRQDDVDPYLLEALRA